MGQKLMTLIFLSLSISLTPGFSNSFDKDKSVTQHFHVAEVSGSRILIENHRMLHFPDIGPDTEYTVLILRGITAENGMNLMLETDQHYIYGGEGSIHDSADIRIMD